MTPGSGQVRIDSDSDTHLVLLFEVGGGMGIDGELIAKGSGICELFFNVFKKRMADGLCHRRRISEFRISDFRSIFNLFTGEVNVLVRTTKSVDGVKVSHDPNQKRNVTMKGHIFDKW